MTLKLIQPFLRNIKKSKIIYLLLIISFLYSVFVLKDFRAKRSYTRVTYQQPIFHDNKCRINKLNEWDPRIKNLFAKIPRYDKCIKHKPLTYIADRKLHIDQAINTTHYGGSITKCEYATVVRDTVERDTFALGTFREFESPLVVIDDFFKVRCLKGEKVEYEYVHSLIQPRAIHEFYKNLPDKSLNGDSKVNVMIFVLDAVSLSSMKRALPKTLEYLKTFENFFLFENHHVVGENTFQNLVPMLSNLNPDAVFKKNKTSKKKSKLEIATPFDDVPFLWKNFSSKMYLTYFSEEWRECTFNNLKFGFRKNPTDYYLRSFWLALYASSSYPPTSLNSNSKPCYYNKLLHEVSIDWLKSMEKFNLDFETENGINNLPRFGLVKINEMSHDYLERLFWIDDDILNLFKYLFTEKFLENTLFIFMGDHGHRLHAIRKNFIGKMEEKLPMFTMLLPKKIMKGKPELREIIKQNTQKLTTWWDIYETLTHILLDEKNISIDYETSAYLQDLEKRKQNQKGISLFTPLPSRDCKEANIPGYLCACQVSTDVNVSDPTILKAAKFLVDHINNELLKDYQDICMKLKLSKILDAQIYATNKNKYSVIFQTSPSEAVFDGTIILEPSNSIITADSFKIDGEIIRVNAYGVSSICIQKYHLKNYCYCYEYHNKKI